MCVAGTFLQEDSCITCSLTSIDASQATPWLEGGLPGHGLIRRCQYKGNAQWQSSQFRGPGLGSSSTRANSTGKFLYDNFFNIRFYQEILHIDPFIVITAYPWQIINFNSLSIACATYLWPRTFPRGGPLTHLPWTKWPPFCRRYILMHFREWKVLYFGKHLTEVCS